MRVLQTLGVAVLGWTVGIAAAPARAASVPVSYDAEGVTIHGELFLPAASTGAVPVAILLHAAQSDRSAWREWIPALERTGCAALAIDLRGHGDSPGPAERDLPARAAKNDRRLFQSMHRDVAGAFEWLAERPEIDLSRIVLMGSGLGGHVALDYAARDRSIDGVVLLAPARDGYGLKSEADAARLGDRPVLVVTSEAERTTAGDPLAAGGRAVQVVVDGAADLAEGTEIGQAPQLVEHVTRFLSSTAGGASEEPVFASVTSDVYHDPDTAAARRIKPHNLRRYSDAAEAERRGLRAARGSGAASGDGGS